MTADQTIAVDLRAFEAADLDVVCRLEREIFSDAWPRSTFQELLDEEAWGGLIAEAENRVIGYACYVFIADEAHLANIAVVEAYRRKSVAKRLLDRILQLAQEAGCRLILLEVRASNEAAQTFYEKAGFHVLHTRPRYYRDPIEDAVVMLLPLTPSTTDE